MSKEPRGKGNRTLIYTDKKTEQMIVSRSPDKRRRGQEGAENAKEKQKNLEIKGLTKGERRVSHRATEYTKKMKFKKTEQRIRVFTLCVLSALV